ncbi:hypothetical protein EK21DRAFT_87065 [Setomelanomma holmii]|uniref:Uncharacterized protein n=1 Tax=Setomelanomma holmii TaxID=210430 RepID=A0A9P4LNX0_9PLEO|nr:hypothetical protein EK21DRAFT_87065 [Setomelanomma holmii]
MAQLRRLAIWNNFERLVLRVGHIVANRSPQESESGPVPTASNDSEPSTATTEFGEVANPPPEQPVGLSESAATPQEDALAQMIANAFEMANPPLQKHQEEIIVDRRQVTTVCRDFAKRLNRVSDLSNRLVPASQQPSKPSPQDAHSR